MARGWRLAACGQSIASPVELPDCLAALLDERDVGLQLVRGDGTVRSIKRFFSADR